MRNLLLSLCLIVSLPVVAQESLGKKLDNKLSKRYYKSSYDSTYVVRPQEKWLLKPSVNQTGTSIHAKGTVK